MVALLPAYATRSRPHLVPDYMRDMISLSMLLGPTGLLRRHALALTLTGLAGMFASAAVVALLARINSALHRLAGPLTEMVLAFTGLGLAMLAGRATAIALSNHTGQAIIRELRLMLAQRILTAPLNALKRYRTHRLVPVLIRDVVFVRQNWMAASLKTAG